MKLKNLMSNELYLKKIKLIWWINMCEEKDFDKNEELQETEDIDNSSDVEDLTPNLEPNQISGIYTNLELFSDTFRKLSETIAIATNTAMQAAMEIGNRIAELVSTIDFSSVIKNLSEAFVPVRYIQLLSELKWPVFLIDDEDLRQKIMDACKDENNAEQVLGIILAYCSDDFLNSVEESWNQCNVICEERKAVLSEALLMHKQGYYFSSVSILMCQLYGVASDIIELASENGLELDDEYKKYIAKHYKIKIEDKDKEKGKLFQMTAMTDGGLLLWNAMANYLKNEILCSSESKKRWESQPLRNKICHGDQLNFGTKEHSLKAILVIDMLVQLAYAINRITSVGDNDDLSE